MFNPTQFGKYYLTERIAVGGMAELFKATLFGVSGFEKLMVVKQILPKYSKNEEFVRMFVDEAKIAVTLTHGNIVPVYELGRIDGVYFIAMEYIHGHDLADILETARTRGLPLSPEHAAYISIEICKGLDYAHRRTDAEGRSLRVVHRDCSPPNILISFDGEVKIADFGIAKAAHKLGSTEAGVVKGTFGYMSPEQVRGLPLDHRTDIFSAGILLYEMLTGRRLFTGDSELEAIERVKLARVTAPSSVNPRVPAAVDPIVFKALAREPGDRFADANELQLELSRFLFTSGKGATASTLSRYLRDLFPDEVKQEQDVPTKRSMPFTDHSREEPTERGPRPRSDRRRRGGEAQSFAISSELERVGQSSSSGPQRKAMDVAGGAGVAVNATLAFPSLASEAGGDGARGSQEYGSQEDRTSVFRGAPQRPEVPALRFPAPQGRPVAVPVVSFPEPAAERGDEFPSGDELAALADQLAEQPRTQRSKPQTPRSKPQTAPLSARPLSAERPASPSASASADEPPVAAEPITEEGLPQGLAASIGPTTQPNARAASGSELINLFAQQTGSQPLVEMAPTEAASPGPAVETRRDREAPRRTTGKHTTGRGAVALPQRSQKISGLISATMRLFVEGLEEEAPAAETPAIIAEPGRAEGAPATAAGGSATGTLEVPRTIKPTIVGWLLIGLVVLGAGLFVLYKKTHLFGGKGSEETTDVIKPEDIRQGELTKPAIKGTIRLDTKTEGASFFYFSGETPTTLSLDAGQAHLIRVERDGFQIVHRTVQPSELSSEKAELKISLQPIGAGARDEIFDFKEGGSVTGRRVAVRVLSEPPVAMVWLLAGRGRVEMGGLDTSKTFNFKVVAPDHPPLLVNVAPADFDKTTGVYTSTVTLDEEGKAEPREPRAEPKAEPRAPKAEPRAEPKAPRAESKHSRIKAEPKHPRIKAEPKHPRIKAEPKLKVRPKTKKVPKKTTKKKSTKPDPKTRFQTPDWAR